MCEERSQWHENKVERESTYPDFTVHVYAYHILEAAAKRTTFCGIRCPKLR